MCYADFQKRLLKVLEIIDAVATLKYLRPLIMMMMIAQRGRTQSEMKSVQGAELCKVNHVHMKLK